MRPSHDNVIRPHMVWGLWLFADTRPIRQPESGPLGLFLGHLQVFLPPQAFHPFVIHCPAFPMQQAGDSSIPIPPVGPRANSMIRIRNPFSSSGRCPTYWCVARQCLSTRHARRSDTCTCCCTWTTASRRRAGLRSFPRRLPARSLCREPGPPPIS
jgi:hypothetical protein